MGGGDVRVGVEFDGRGDVRVGWSLMGWKELRGRGGV